MSPRRWLLAAVLVGLGAAWGLTTPLIKVAVSGGYRPFGIIVWQFVIVTLLFGTLVRLRGQSLPFAPANLRLYAIIAAVGALLPNAASYQAAVYLPAGLIAILLATVPMFAFAIALALGDERLHPARLAGLGLGLLGIVMIMAPETALPSRGMLLFVPLALIAPFLYGVEGNVVSRLGTGALDPIQVLLGASLVGLPVSIVLALATGQWIWPPLPFDKPDYAILSSSLVNSLTYACYIWLIGQAGAVFAAQVAYLVTGFGVLWSSILLGESYSGWVWAALLSMFAGLALVQPRQEPILSPVPGDTNEMT